MSTTTASRTVLITGSSSGFGLALTRHFLSQSCWNVIATSRNPDATPDLVSEIDSHTSGRGRWLRLDVCDSQDQINKVIAAAEDAFGKGSGLDVVINNAGYSILGPLETVDEEKARAMMDANFWGTVKVCKAAIPGLRLRAKARSTAAAAAAADGDGNDGNDRVGGRGRGRGCWIVNFSSIAGINANANVGIYAASKFAVEAISESLAQELAPFDVRVLLVEPGMFLTNFFNANANANANANTNANANVRNNASYHLAPLPEHYRGTSVETSHDAFANASQGNQRGDVYKAAERVQQVVDGTLVIVENGGGGKDATGGTGSGAVQRMLLGPDAFQRAEKALRAKLEVVLAGRDVAASTDRDGVS